MTEKPKKRVHVVLPPALTGDPESLSPAYRKLRDEEIRAAEEREDGKYIERWQAQIETWKAIHERVAEKMKESE